MPAYNEEDTIEGTIRHCFEVLKAIPGDHEIVVTNDGSKDRTLEILESFQKKHPSLSIVSYSPNEGYGAAMTHAIRQSRGQVVVSIDSDGQFDIAQLPGLLKQFDSDILTGYRKSKQDSRARVYADRIMNLIIRMMFGIPFKDTNCAFKLYRGDAIRQMNLEACGFQLPTEIVLKASAMGWKVHEAPVDHHPRPAGKSALAPFRTAYHMLVFLWYLRLKIALFRMKALKKL